MNRGFTSVVIFLDFAKAFDKVSHRALLVKLQIYGFTGKIHDWLSDFLAGRRQRVVLGDVVSDCLDVLSGVPQGSVLGPLLFVVFINDMPGAVHNLCKLFADDTKLIGIIKNQMDIGLLQKDVDKLVESSSEWQMCFNDEKCVYMTINNKYFDIDMKMNGVSLKKSVRERDLGINICSDLKWHYQTTLAANIATMLLCQLSRAFNFWTIKSFKRLYTVFVRPHLEYAVTAWCPHNKMDIMVL